MTIRVLRTTADGATEAETPAEPTTSTTTSSGIGTATSTTGGDDD